MLDKLKELLKSITVKILFGFLVISFVLSGALSMMDNARQQRIAAIVGDEEITQIDLSRKKQQLAMELQQKYSGELTTQQLENFGLEQKALRDLINQALLVNLAKKYDINFSKDKLIEYIRQSAQFKDDNGNFDEKLYEGFKRSFGFNDIEYLKEVKNSVRADILQKLISLNNHIPAEFNNYLESYLNEKFNFSLYSINIDKLQSSGDYGDEELKNIYEKYKQQLILPEKRGIELAFISPAKMKKNIKVSSEEIKEYYEDNISDYKEPQKFTFTDLKFSTYSEAEKFLQSVNTNGLDRAIKDYYRSERDKFKYIDLDASLISKGLFDNLSELKPGEISKIIKVGELYHIVQLDSKKQAYTLPLNSVKKEIIEEIKENKLVGVMEEYKETIEEDLAEEDMDISSLAKKHGMEHFNLKATNNNQFISRLSKKLPAQIDSQNLVSELFAKEEQNRVLDKEEPYDKGILIAEVSNIEEPRVGKFEEVQDRLKQIAAEEKARGRLTKLTSSGNKKAGTMAKKLNIPGSVRSFVRYNIEEGSVNLPEELLNQITSASSGEYTDIVASEDQKTLYLAKIDSITSASDNEKISRSNIEEKTNIYLNSILMQQLFDYLRQDIAVKIYR
jgi:peptidyl-prolyl cis-trans isomerase D